MKSISRHLTTLALVGGLSASLFASNAAAQEQVASDLVLRKTYMKTDDTFMPPNIFGVVPVFTPTTVSCPGGGTCTVRVEISAEMAATSGEIYGAVSVDQQVVQGYVALISAEPSETQKGTHTHTWMVRGLAPGDHTIDVNVWFTSILFPTWVNQRTLTISVYKP